VTVGLEVRNAQAGDATALHLLLARAFAEYEGRLDPPSGANAETPASIARSSVKAGRLSAVRARRSSMCLLRAEKRSLYVGRLSVTPGHRKRGIGDLLLHTAEQHATTLWLPSVRIWCAPRAGNIACVLRRPRLCVDRAALP